MSRRGHRNGKDALNRSTAFCDRVGVGQPGGGTDFFDGIFQLYADMLEQGFILALFLIVDLVDIEITLFCTPQLFTVVFVKCLGYPFVDRIGHQQDLIVLRFELFEQGAVDQSRHIFTGDVIDLFLIRRHALDVLLK